MEKEKAEELIKLIGISLMLVLIIIPEIGYEAGKKCATLFVNHTL